VEAYRGMGFPELNGDVNIFTFQPLHHREKVPNIHWMTVDGWTP
jgi:hypothetical protein